MRTALVALLAAALVPTCAPAHAEDRVTITTQNVRVGMPFAHVRHDIEQAAEHSSIVLTQEQGERRARDFAPSGWGTAHFGGVRRGDCATYWDRDDWRFDGARTKQLTYAPFRAGHRFALLVNLHARLAPHTHVSVICVHLITKTMLRRLVFRRGMRRLGVMLRFIEAHHPYGHVIVGGDWNRGWPRRARFDGFGSWQPPRATGHHGGRIDYFEQQSRRVVPMRIRVIGGTFSDHNGVRMRFALR